MKLAPEIAWRTLEGRPAALDARLLPLLRQIRDRATLRAAVAPLGMSYRGAWDLLGAQARLLGAPLVRMARGRGARLAPLGEQLVAADDAARRALAPARARLVVQVADEPQAGRLRVAASHDLLLAEFGAAMLDLVFRGSLESVRAYARGEADLAGFHVPAQAADPVGCHALLRPRRDCLIRFARREQGLLLAAGNPHRVRSLADVARLGLRFVNRQRGSGTRQLVDHLLGAAGLEPGEVKGYAEEEYTHVAVAATIAAGRADAGVGVRAAAARFGLAFRPLEREHYWLVARRRAIEEARLRRFVEALRGPALPRLARRLAGYDVRGAGAILPVDALAAAGGRP